MNLRPAYVFCTIPRGKGGVDVCVWAGTRKAAEEWVRAQLIMSPRLCSQASSGLRICVF